MSGERSNRENNAVSRNPAEEQRAQGYSNDRNFKGMTPELGGVLALPAETYVQARVTFTKFQELLSTYLMKTFGNIMTPEVIKAIREMTDPVGAFTLAHKPTPPDGDKL